MHWLFALSLFAFPLLLLLFVYLFISSKTHESPHHLCGLWMTRGIGVVDRTTMVCNKRLTHESPSFLTSLLLGCMHFDRMAFTMGKEMICPLCRFLHKDQPFMGPEEVSSKLPVPSSPSAVAAAAAVAAASIASTQTVTANSATVASGGRNRHRNNSIHLQHNLSNLMHHQQRRRSTYDLRRASVTSLSSPSTSPTPVTTPVQDSPNNESSILSRVPYFGVASHAPQPEQPSPPIPSPSLSTAPSSTPSLQPHAYLNTSTWFMLYGMPFSVAMLFLAFILGQVETMWSKVSCLIGSAICYMVCWALAVGFVVPAHVCPVGQHSDPEDLASSTATATAAAAAAAATAATTAASVGYASPNSGTGSVASTVSNVVSGSLPRFPVSVSVSPTIPSSMAFEFELASDLGLDTSSPHPPSSRSTSESTYPFQYIYQIRERQQQQQQQQHHHQPQHQQQPQQQRQSNESGLERREEEVLVSSLTMFSWLNPGASSLSRWMVASQYARDLRRRISDLADILDDYSESFGGW